MQFSQKIIDYSQNPQIKTNDIDSGHKTFLLKLETHKAYIEINYYISQKDGEDYFEHLTYKTALLGPYLGIIEGLFSLCLDKPTEVMDRITAKELDHYLRDTPSNPSVEYYSQEFYEVLSIGEKLLKSIYKKEEDQLIYEELDAAFFELSFSEQIEAFEEFLSKHMYKDLLFRDMFFDLADCDDREVLITSNQRLKDDQKSEFLKQFKKELNLKEVNIKFEQDDMVGKL